MSLHESPHAVRRPGWRGYYRLVPQVPPHVGGQLAHARVAAIGFLFQRLHDDPIQVVAKLTDEQMRFGVARIATRLAWSLSWISRVLGRGSSTSRIICRTSATLLPRQLAESNGRSPLSNSYRITPSA